MKKKRLVTLFGSICVALILVALPFVGACATTAPATAPETIKIGAAVSLTGGDTLGVQAEAGYTIAIEDINREGGVYVKEYDRKIPLELVVVDMESDAEKAISRTEYLITVEKVPVLVGTTWFAAASSTLEREKIPGVAVASTSQRHFDEGYKYWFTVLGSTPDYAKGSFDLLDSIPKAERPSKVVIFEWQSDIGVEYSKYWQEEIEKRGYELTSIQKHTIMNLDFSPQILAAKSSGAEVVLSMAIMPDQMTMMKQMKELDFNPKAVFCIMGADDLPWGQALGKIGEYVLTMSGWHHTLPLPGVAELNAAHQAKFGRPADVTTGPAYASIQVIADAIERAGTLDSVKIRDALAVTNMMTVAGPVKFYPDQGRPMEPEEPVIQWQSGIKQVVYPNIFMTKPLIYPIPSWAER